VVNPFPLRGYKSMLFFLSCARQRCGEPGEGPFGLVDLTKQPLLQKRLQVKLSRETSGEIYIKAKLHADLYFHNSHLKLKELRKIVDVANDV
jgi:hypothetical protein